MRRPVLLASLAALALGACGRDEAPSANDALPRGARPEIVRASELHPGPVAPGNEPRNPLAGSTRAERDGERLFHWMNCAGCHGAKGGGGIGPPLRDADWIYGGSDAQIYMSILQGRPNGMPSYGGRLTDQLAWQLVSYIRSLERESAGGGNQSPTEAEGGS